MKVAIDGSSILRSRTGIGHYTYQLMQWLGKLDQVTQYDFLFYSWKIRVDTLEAPQYPNYFFHDYRIPGKLLMKSWQYLGMPSVNRFIESFDIFHSPNYLFQPHTSGKTVCTIHDLAFMKFSGYGHKYGGQYFARVLPRTIKRADAIIADSEATKTDLLELMGIPEERIHVIHLGIDPEFGQQGNREEYEQLRKRLGFGKDYLLAVTTLEPRKNLKGILEAMALFRNETRSDIPLVICGAEGWETASLHKSIQSLGLGSWVHLTGYINQRALAEFYHNAQLTLFPSFYEGFGLPILESMACGTPVITSNISSMPEVAGDAAVLVDPDKPAEIAHAIQTCLDDSGFRETLIKKGYDRIKQFSWETTARKTIDVYSL